MDSLDYNSSTSRLNLDSYYTAEGDSAMSEDTLNARSTNEFDAQPMQFGINESRRENLLFILSIPTEAEELRMRAECSISAAHNVRTMNDMPQRTNSLPNQTAVVDVGKMFTQLPSSDAERSARASHKNAEIKFDMVHERRRCVNDALNTEPKEHNSYRSVPESIQSSRGKTGKSSENKSELDLPPNTPLEHVLQAMLRKLHVTNAIWTKDVNGKILQVMFPVEYEQTYEQLLDILYDWGIGERVDSSIAVINCMASKFYEEPQNMEIQCKKMKSQSAWKRFTDSVRCRLSVINVVNEIRSEASLSFDFCVLVISAAVQAGLGLIDNSFIFLISSMLISPLMGPILAAVFGITIKDGKLCRKGTRNEFVGLALAIFVGFLFGLCVCTLAHMFGSGASVSAEMLARSEVRTLALGVLTAITSGIAVTVAILDGNVGSLIGVAISASILPPAVNSGILWSYACLSAYDVSRFGNIIDTAYFSQSPALELFILGGLSICLTMINIFCIFGMGITMLKVKEIAPVVARQDRLFWQRDVKLARKMQKTGYDVDKALLDEFFSLPQSDQDALGINSSTLRNFKSTDAAGGQQSWAPLNNFMDDVVDDPFDDNYETVYNLKRLFATVNYSQTLRRRPHANLALSTKFGLLGNNNDYRNVTEIFAQGISTATSSTQTGLDVLHELDSSGSITSSVINTSQRRKHKRHHRFTITPVATHAERLNLFAEEKSESKI